MKLMHLNILTLFVIILIYNSVRTVNSYCSLYSRPQCSNNTKSKLAPIPSWIGPKLQQLDLEFSRCGSSRIDIRELTILQIQLHFKNNKLSSSELTSCYLQRIEKMDPYLKAVIEINKDAVATAESMDMERLIGIERGLLHGIPILLKDNFATVDGMQTTAGARAMEFVMPTQEGEVVKQLRNAGAVILGKSNPSEWAYFRGNQIPSGWSGRGGQTKSPYVLSSDPSGSSTGSAVGVAANLAAVALGTETDGSITSPASFASAVGLKATVGSVSTEGIIPLSFTQDTAGPITRSVSDAAIILNIIQRNGKLRKNGNTLEMSLNHKTFRVGVIRSPFWNASDSTIVKIIPQLETALKVLRGTGKVKVVEQIPTKSESLLLNRISAHMEMTVFRHEFKYGINKYLREQTFHLEPRLGRLIRSLADIITFNKKNPPPEGYNQDSLIASDATDGINNRTYKAFRDQNKQVAEDYINTVLKRNSLDVLAGPCESDTTTLLYNIGAMSGYPSITVPVGTTLEGIPFGICFLGRANSEELLLKLAYILEQAHPMRQTPMFWN